MSNPLDRDMARLMRDMRRKLAQEALRPKKPMEVEEMAEPGVSDRLGPSEVAQT